MEPITRAEAFTPLTDQLQVPSGSPAAPEIGMVFVTSNHWAEARGAYNVQTDTATNAIRNKVKSP